jgi:hypothetical protein
MTVLINRIKVVLDVSEELATAPSMAHLKQQWLKQSLEMATRKHLVCGSSR